MIAIRNEKDFVKIIDNRNIYYGGNQAWFEDEIGRVGGCGPVAVANIMAYYGYNKNQATLYKGKMTKEDYLIHINEVLSFIKPIKVPEIIAGTCKRIPVTLGVPLMSQLAGGAKRLAKNRGVMLDAYKYNGGMHSGKAYDYIKSALNKDCPVALLIYRNKSMGKVMYEDYSGKHLQANIQMHWVTITGIKENENGQKILKASSWGGWVWIPLKDCVEHTGFGGLVYFH